MMTVSTGDSSARRQLRVPFKKAVSLRLRDTDEFVSEVSADLSVGGMRVRANKPMPPGSHLDFALRLTNSRIQGSGKVVWLREVEEMGPPWALGISFSELGKVSSRLIHETVNQCLSKTTEPPELRRQELAKAKADAVGMRQESEEIESKSRDVLERVRASVLHYVNAGTGLDRPTSRQADARADEVGSTRAAPHLAEDPAKGQIDALQTGLCGELEHSRKELAEAERLRNLVIARLNEAKLSEEQARRRLSAVSTERQGLAAEFEEFSRKVESAEREASLAMDDLSRARDRIQALQGELDAELKTGRSMLEDAELQRRRLIARLDRSSAALFTVIERLETRAAEKRELGSRPSELGALVSTSCESSGELRSWALALAEDLDGFGRQLISLSSKLQTARGVESELGAKLEQSHAEIERNERRRTLVEVKEVDNVATEARAKEELAVPTQVCQALNAALEVATNDARAAAETLAAKAKRINELDAPSRESEAARKKLVKSLEEVEVIEGRLRQGLEALSARLDEVVRPMAPKS